jgi:hypothetical protein
VRIGTQERRLAWKRSWSVNGVRVTGTVVSLRIEIIWILINVGSKWIIVKRRSGRKIRGIRRV